MQHWKEACAAGGTDFLYDDHDGKDDDDHDATLPYPGIIFKTCTLPGIFSLSKYQGIG